MKLTYERGSIRQGDLVMVRFKRGVYVWRGDSRTFTSLPGDSSSHAMLANPTNGETFLVGMWRVKKVEQPC